MRDELEPLLAGEVPYVFVGQDEMPDQCILLSGSFNPLHTGHAQLLRAAETVSGRDGLLELSVINVDKPPLGIAEVERRLLQINRQFCAVLTRAPTFAEKAELFPGAWFAMGYDTAVRLLDPSYHSDILSMLARFAELKIRFVVAGRLHNGEFLSLKDLAIPSAFEELFVPIPEALFREDISSTELRDGGLY